MFSRRDFFKQGLLPVFAGSAVPSIFANGVAAAAARIVAELVRGQDAVRLALAGGSTPRRCHELLAAMSGVETEVLA